MRLNYLNCNFNNIKQINRSITHYNDNNLLKLFKGEEFYNTSTAIILKKDNEPIVNYFNENKLIAP